MRRDFAVSVLSHLALVALIIIVNPTTTRLGIGPDVMTVDLGGLQAPGPKEIPAQAPPQEEEKEPAEIPASPELLADADMQESFAVRSRDTLASIVKEKKPEPKPRKREEKPKPKETTSRKPEPVVAKTDQEPEAETGSSSDAAGGGLDIEAGVSVGSGSGYGDGSGSFNLPYNIGMLRRKVERAWRNPVSSPNTVVCTIYFQIGRDGTLIGEPVVEKSSGITIYDQEAVYAVRRVDRFPEFPSGFEYDYIGIHMDFSYVP